MFGVDLFLQNHINQVIRDKSEKSAHSNVAVEQKRELLNLYLAVFFD